MCGQPYPIGSIFCELFNVTIVKENQTLKDIALNHNISITQVIMRWHVQHNVIPIFRSFNPNHIKDNTDIFNFELSPQEMNAIYALNIDYKFHPESLNCPGY